MTWVSRLLRALAIAIAVLGVIDPVFTGGRASRPLIAVIDAGSTTATDVMARGLSRAFDVHTGAIAGAAGTVLVGASLPAEAPVAAGVLVAAVPAPAPRSVTIERLLAPSTATPGSEIPVDVKLHVRGAAGRTLRVDVVSGGVLLDRATPAVASNDETVEVSLSAVTRVSGLARLLVRVGDNASADPALMAEAVTATAIEAERWPVLVVDARPSWMSSFVRRALEADRRFMVASRVSTSRGIEAESGRAPALTDPAALEPYAAVVVGAPDALTAPEVRALEAFARRRGGAVVMVMDRLDRGPFAVLTGASWRDVHGVERRKLVTSRGTMIATELAVADGLSSGADVLAAAGDGRPVVWQVPLGAGRVIVSGALDAWRYRSREGNGFARFWTGVMSEAAASAPAAIAIEPSRRVARGASVIDVRVSVRSVQLSDPDRPAPVVDVRAVGALTGSRDFEALRLWPTPERGVFAGAVALPNTPGTYRIAATAVVSGASAIEEVTDVLLEGVRPLKGSDPLELAAWTTAHGGVVIPGADAGTVESALAERSHGARPRSPVHPMRSLWWLSIFVIALGGEWWLRRRRGER